MMVARDSPHEMTMMVVAVGAAEVAVGREASSSLVFLPYLV